MELTKQKNRQAEPTESQINREVTLEGLLNSKDNETIFSSKNGAVVKGYVYAVSGQNPKKGLCNSSEGCDFLIYLAKDEKADKLADCAVAVITPATMALNPQINWEYVKSLKKRHVEVAGWLLFDAPQTKSSYETHPYGFKPDRRTAWAIYPATTLRIDE